MPNKKKEILIQKQYNAQVESGDLKIMYPEMSGEWLTDRKQYIREYNAIENLISHLDDKSEDELDIDF